MILWLLLNWANFYSALVNHLLCHNYIIDVVFNTQLLCIQNPSPFVVSKTSNYCDVKSGGFLKE